MRKQKWNLINIRDGLERFHSEFGKYPTATEFEDCPYLPSARQTQRRFGGLIELRQLLKLNGPFDLTKGEHSSKRARDINERAQLKEKEVYDYLTLHFGKPFVHREYLFDDKRKVRADFFIYTKSGGFAVDVFYPRDKHNLTGCLNIKMKTYGRS
jgi:hypothetical protein